MTKVYPKTNNTVRVGNIPAAYRIPTELLLIDELICAGILIIPLLDIILQFKTLFPQLQSIGPVIKGISWLVFFLSIIWLFSRKKHYLFKFLAVALFIKTVIYAYSYGTYGLNKDLICIPLLTLMIFEDSAFGTILSKNYQKVKYTYLMLLLITYLPFIGRTYVNAAEGVRVIGLWDRGKDIASYLLTFIISCPVKRILEISLLSVAVLPTGTRGGILASIFYYIYVMGSNMRSAIFNGKIGRLAIIISLLLVFLLGQALGWFDVLIQRTQHNLQMLFRHRIDDPAFGHGRVFLIRIVLKGISDFSITNWIFGKSMDELLDLYDTDYPGHRTWPHNDFLTVLYCHGLIGLYVFVYYLFIFPIVRFSRFRKSRLLAVLVVIAILSASYGYTNFLSSYLFLGCLAVISRQAQTKSIRRKFKGAGA